MRRLLPLLFDEEAQEALLSLLTAKRRSFEDARKVVVDHLGQGWGMPGLKGRSCSFYISPWVNAPSRDRTQTGRLVP